MINAPSGLITDDDGMDGFEEIFKRLPKEAFREDPKRILSYMMDFGFDPRQVKMLRTVMDEDMVEVKDFLESPKGSGFDILENIADYCYVSKDVLAYLLEGIRSSLGVLVKTTIIDDKDYGRCRISSDGIAKYSLDMAVLLRVSDTDSFVIPDSVTSIGKGAFSDCGFLKEIVIPDSVTNIGDGAFSRCESINFTVDDGNEKYSSESGALFDKDKRELIVGYPLVHDGKCVIPDSVTSIGKSAFSDCGFLKEIVIPDSVTDIGDGAFSRCDSARFIVNSNNRFYESEHGKLVKRKEPKPSVDSINVVEKVYPDGRYTGKLINGKRTGKGVLQFQNGNVYEGDFADDKMAGRGKYTWKNGDLYEGDFKDDWRTGKGRLTGMNGDVYEGEFVGGKMSGKGKYTWKNGDIYEGDFKDDGRTGKGRLTRRNGDVYEGNFLNGKKTGKGKCTWGFGNWEESVYEGDYVDNMRIGKGRLMLKNGDIYEGDFKDDRRTGKGRLTLKNGDIYEGDFVDGKETGKGKYTWKNGNVYEGDFVDDRMAGKGKYMWDNGRNFCEGDFVNGKLVRRKEPELVGDSTNVVEELHSDGRYTENLIDGKRTGKGVLRLPNGDVYEGDFVDGKRTGKGVLHFQNGNVYEGDFANNKMAGKGKYTWKNGDIYEGDFKDDWRTGKGRLTRSNGDIYEGGFENGFAEGNGTLHVGKITYIGKSKNGLFKGKGGHFLGKKIKERL